MGFLLSAHPTCAAGLITVGISDRVNQEADLRQAFVEYWLNPCSQESLMRL